MKLQHIRHGSHIIEYKGRKLLVDPVFAKKGSMSSLPLGLAREKNPLTVMPFNLDFIKTLDGIMITHMHFDHFDEIAINTLPKDLPIFCHVRDKNKIEKKGFNVVVGISDELVIFNDIQMKVVGGKHGRGIVGLLMGKTSGFILKDPEKVEPTTYIIGDSIWYDYINRIILSEKPDVIIAFAGEAKILNQAITMGKNDIHNMAQEFEGHIVAIHMDTWNHCFLTRDKLKSFVKGQSYSNRLLIPEDGETIILNS